VIVEGEPVARIGKGLLALVAISRQDVKQDLQWMAKKIIDLRIFEDSQGKMNLGLQDVDGQLLLISQFTLYGDAKKDVGLPISRLPSRPKQKNCIMILCACSSIHAGCSNRQVPGYNGCWAYKCRPGDYYPG